MKIKTFLNKMITITLAFTMLLTGVLIVDTTEVSAASFPTIKATAKVTKATYIRNSASTKAKSVKKISKGAKVTVTKEFFMSKTSTAAKYRWYYVYYGGKRGFIRSDYLGSFSYTTVSAKTTDALNYRAGAGTGMKKKGHFKKGTNIKVVLPAKAAGSKKVWYKIKAGTTYYYVCGDYIKCTQSTTAAAAATTTSVTTSSGKLTFTVSGITCPTKLGECLPYTLKGKITATKPIEKVEFGIVNEAGEWVITTTKTVNATTFDVSKVDGDIRFGTLEPGKYTYRGDVYVDGVCYTQVSKNFEILKLSGPEKITNTAVTLAWPKGTSSSTYSYSGGAPTAAFKVALNEVYPNRSSWGAAPKVGASCDVFVGTVCRYSGYDKEMPRGLGDTTAGQWATLAKSDKWQRITYSAQESDLRSGDIIIYKRKTGSQHVCIYVKIDGKGYLAEAAIKTSYGHIAGLSSKIFNYSDKEKLYVYRATQ